MDNLKISIDNKNEIEKFILINIIGLMHSLNDLNINNEIVNLIEEGCKLEDLESPIPDKLSNAINNIKNKAVSLLPQKQSEKDEYKKWID